MENLTQVGLLVLVIMALCQAAKVAGLQGRWVPLLGVALGIGGSLYFDGVNFLATAGGVMLGLSSSGLYQLVKKTVLDK